MPLIFLHLGMIVHLVPQEIKMTTSVGEAVVKTVGGVWIDLRVNRNHSQSQLLLKQMTGKQQDITVEFGTM